MEWRVLRVVGGVVRMRKRMIEGRAGRRRTEVRERWAGR